MSTFKQYTNFKVSIKIGYNLLCAYFLALLIFFSTRPFFTWSLGSTAWVFSFVCLVATAFYYDCFKANLKRNIYIIILVYTVYVSYVFLPFRHYDNVQLGFFTMLSVILIFLIKNEIFFKAVSILVNIYFVISLLSIMSFVLYLLNISFPEIVVSQSFRTSDQESYILYFGNIILSSQIMPLGNNVSIYRLSGWFAEPGHFGFYLCALLALLKDPFSGIKGKVLLLAAILTFSAYAYLCLFIIFISKMKSTKGMMYIVVSLFATSVLFYLIIDTPFYDRFFSSRFEGDSATSVLFDRASEGNFAFRFGLSEFLFGYGRDFISDNNLILSDFRATFYRFGITYFVFATILILTLLTVIDRKTLNRFAPLYLILMLGYLHRAWLIDHIYFYFFLFYPPIYKYSAKEKHVDN